MLGVVTHNGRNSPIMGEMAAFFALLRLQMQRRQGGSKDDLDFSPFHAPGFT